MNRPEVKFDQYFTPVFDYLTQAKTRPHIFVNQLLTLI